MHSMAGQESYTCCSGATIERAIIDGGEDVGPGRATECRLMQVTVVFVFYGATTGESAVPTSDHPLVPLSLTGFYHYCYGHNLSWRV